MGFLCIISNLGISIKTTHMNIKTLLSTSLLLSSFSLLAQQATKTFAITGNGSGDFRWMNIRQVDITTGKVVQNIFFL